MLHRAAIANDVRLLGLALHLAIQSRLRLPSAPTGTTRKSCLDGFPLRKSARAGGLLETADRQAAVTYRRASQLRANRKRYAFHERQSGRMPAYRSLL